MGNLLIDSDINDISTEIESILGQFNVLNNQANRLVNSHIDTSGWMGEAKDKCQTMMEEFNIPYIDNIRFLYEALLAHITEFAQDAEGFIQTSDCMEYLRD